MNLATRSETLINAIKKYELDHKMPPVSLENLIPDYIEKIPSTKISAYPNYSYSILPLGKNNADNKDQAPAWELRVECSIGFLNWDVFFYWPTEKYPERIYGGSTRRYGNWVYVHE